MWRYVGRFTMNLKESIDNVISHLTDEYSISTILLKSQVIAHQLHNKEFSKWIECEQNGYDDDTIPNYRKIQCQLVAHIFVPNQGEQDHDFQIDFIKDPNIRKCLRKMSLGYSLSKIETLKSNNIADEQDNSIRMEVPAPFFKHIKPLFRQDVEIYNLYQTVTLSDALALISIFKSKLLDFFLNLDDSIGENLDINKMDTKSKQTLTQTINASIVNLGLGKIEVNDSNVINGNSNTISISDDKKQEIEKILNDIENLKAQMGDDEKEITEYISDIRKELANSSQQPTVIKKCLRALKSFGIIATNHILLSVIDKIIDTLLYRL